MINYEKSFRSLVFEKDKLIKVDYHNLNGRFSQFVRVEIPQEIMQKFYKACNISTALRVLEHYCLRVVKAKFKIDYNDTVENVSIVDIVETL